MEGGRGGEGRNGLLDPGARGEAIKKRLLPLGNCTLREQKPRLAHALWPHVMKYCTSTKYKEVAHGAHAIAAIAAIAIATDMDGFGGQIDSQAVSQYKLWVAGVAALARRKDATDPPRKMDGRGAATGATGDLLALTGLCRIILPTLKNRDKNPAGGFPWGASGVPAAG